MNGIQPNRQQPPPQDVRPSPLARHNRFETLRRAEVQEMRQWFDNTRRAEPSVNRQLLNRLVGLPVMQNRLVVEHDGQNRHVILDPDNSPRTAPDNTNRERG